MFKKFFNTIKQKLMPKPMKASAPVGRPLLAPPKPVAKEPEPSKARHGNCSHNPPGTKHTPPTLMPNFDGRFTQLSSGKIILAWPFEKRVRIQRGGYRRQVSYA